MKLPPGVVRRLDRPPIADPLQGERKTDDDTAGKDYFVREVTYGAFQRSSALPEGVDVE